MKIELVYAGEDTGIIVMHGLSSRERKNLEKLSEEENLESSEGEQFGDCVEKSHAAIGTPSGIALTVQLEGEKVP